MPLSRPAAPGAPDGESARRRPVVVRDLAGARVTARDTGRPGRRAATGPVGERRGTAGSGADDLVRS